MNRLGEEELAEAVDVVCMTLFDMPVPVSHSLPAEMQQQECMDAEIQITGAWQGRVQVRATLTFLRHAAASIFLKDHGEVDHQDCVDTITELTNMLGGTIKCLLPESCNLGLPVIVQREVDVCLGKEWHHFGCNQKGMAVALQESPGEQIQAA